MTTNLAGLEDPFFYLVDLFWKLFQVFMKVHMTGRPIHLPVTIPVWGKTKASLFSINGI